MRTREKGFNIDVTRGQYMMLYNIMCEHNQMVNPESNPDFDLQTFDNLFQSITMAKETYLSSQQKQTLIKTIQSMSSTSKSKETMVKKKLLESTIWEISCFNL